MYDYKRGGWGGGGGGERGERSQLKFKKRVRKRRGGGSRVIEKV